MALCYQDWDIINKNLFIEGVKFWRAGHFNMKTGEEFYTCSELRRTKCPCMALVRYFKKVEKSVPLPPPSNVPSARVGDHAAGGQGQGEVADLAGGDQGQDEDDDHGCEGDMVDDDFIFEEDPRDNKMKYDVVSLNYKLSKLSI